MTVCCGPACPSLLRYASRIKGTPFEAHLARAAFQSFLAKTPPAMRTLVPLAQLNLGMACAETHDIPCARTVFQAFLSNVPPAYENLVPQAQANLNAMH